MASVYLNGEWLPIEEARIPVMDRGFLFGDGVYEVVPVYSRRPFRLEQHLLRLQASLDGVRLPNPHSTEQWAALFRRMIDETPFEDQSIYLQITRGADSKRNHAFPTGVAPTVFMMGEALSAPSLTQREEGISAVSAADNRWHRCDIKSVSLLANVLLRQRAIDAGCVETVLFRDGFMTEGAASNIFAVKDGVLLAPQKNHLMLPGITYDVILELAAAHGVPCRIHDVLETQVRAADELWMTSSNKEVLPIVTLDGRPVGDGRPGPLYARMHRWYQEFKATVMRHG